MSILYIKTCKKFLVNSLYRALNTWVTAKRNRNIMIGKEIWWKARRLAPSLPCLELVSKFTRVSTFFSGLFWNNKGDLEMLNEINFVHALERFLNVCFKAKTKVIARTNRKLHGQTNQSINQSIKTHSKYIFADAKRGKTRASKSRLVSVSLLTEWENGARF